jgi:hypothetical protein
MGTATPMTKNKVTTVTAMAMRKNMGTIDTVIKRRLPANPTASKALTRL